MNLDEMKALPADRQKELFLKLDQVRAAGKATNYACQYSAGAATIARTAKVSDKVAKRLHKGYWELNWTIEKIASLMKVKTTSFGTWQQNPINKMWYSLRTDKDRFSTLVQGSGAYVLDVWLFHVKRIAAKRNLDFKLLGQFHKLIVA